MTGILKYSAEILIPERNSENFFIRRKLDLIHTKIHEKNPENVRIETQKKYRK